MASTFSPWKQVILSTTPVLTGSLSAIGSSLIVYLIFTDHRRKLNRTYHRLLLGLSLSDIQNSIRACFSAFLMPSDLEGVWGAFGNQRSCSALGFFTQLGMASTFYSICLAIYYVIHIQATKTSKTLKKVEPWMHLLSVLHPLATAIAGVFLNLYNPVQVGIGCWVAAYPAGCQDNENVICDRGQNAAIFIWPFAGIVVAMGMIIVAFCMVAVYLKVRRQLRLIELRYSVVDHQNTNLVSSYRLRQTRRQAMLYIGVFFATYVWTTIGRLVENNVENPSFFAVSFLAQVFYPLQGFLNCFVYIYPRYSNLRLKHPREKPARTLRRVFEVSKRDISHPTVTSTPLHPHPRQTNVGKSTQTPVICLSADEQKESVVSIGSTPDSSECHQGGVVERLEYTYNHPSDECDM